MKQPISIAPLLWDHQTARSLDTHITHGKGRKGIIIRGRSLGKTKSINRFIPWGHHDRCNS
ncbi:hypothetical protein [Hafnia alvei]|uniref:hypothetical protein n=1 Tax=Hafnia alvei TaxID=569 RepID=UPI0009C15D68|nr:hypothetical protein [Hafnia alvei]TBL60030.1 hypothetical protein EYY92_13630 [Hafnia alvei]